ncbi:MAG: hypothetical protein WD468_06000 [Pirellulales bacterium]
MFDEQEPGKFELAPELAALQRQLAQLTPTAPRVDRDQLMFDAGRAAERAGQYGRAIYLAGPSWAGRFSHRFWPAATATMTAATILLSATFLWQRLSPPIAHESALPQTSAIAKSADVPSDRVNTWPTRPRATSGYLAVRDAALTRGIGALANERNYEVSTSPQRAVPATARQLLEELLPNSSRQRG